MWHGIGRGHVEVAQTETILDRGAHMAALEKDKPTHLLAWNLDVSFLGVVRIQYSTNQVRDSPENTLRLNT